MVILNVISVIFLKIRLEVIRTHSKIKEEHQLYHLLAKSGSKFGEISCH